MERIDPILGIKIPVTYIPTGEAPPEVQSIKNFNEQDDRALADHPKLRRIIVRLAPNWPPVLLYLHWSDGTDLVQLDTRVSNNSATESDFSGAHAGEAQRVSCFKCGSLFRAVMPNAVVPIFDDQVRRFRSHRYKTHCPVCGERMVQTPLEFIDAG
ncbi:hypothetical protein [Streptomyces sp. C36]|uniref:hypothetical protein n=1 Tax=Streptomyces sp. C36 TaxID=3237122 RepID=UPI0034C6BE44